MRELSWFDFFSALRYENKDRTKGVAVLIKQSHPIADATAAELATEILIWLSGKPDLMKRFLEMSGIQADEIRGQIGKPSFSAGLIGFIMNHEPDLLDFSYERSIPADHVQRCHDCITGHHAFAQPARDGHVP